MAQPLKQTTPPKYIASPNAQLTFPAAQYKELWRSRAFALPPAELASDDFLGRACQTVLNPTMFGGNQFADFTMRMSFREKH